MAQIINPIISGGWGLPFLDSLAINGITDLNDAVTQGKYIVSLREDGYQNLQPDWSDPKGNGYLLVFCSGYLDNIKTSFIAIQFFCGYDGTIYVREHWYNKWHKWNKFS